MISLVTLGTWFVFVSAWATDLSHPQLPRLVCFWALALTLLLTGRVIVRTLAERTDAYVQRSVVVGAGHVGQLVARKIQQHPEYGITLVGFVDEDPRIRSRRGRPPAGARRAPATLEDFVCAGRDRPRDRGLLRKGRRTNDGARPRAPGPER